MSRLEYPTATYLSGLLGGQIHSVLSPVSTQSGYAAWKIWPVAIPEVGALIECMNQRTLDRDLFWQAVEHFGASNTERPGAEIAGKCWQAVEASSRPIFSLSVGAQAWWMGLFGEEWWRHICKRHGWHEQWQWDLLSDIHNPMDVHTVMRMDRLGLIPIAQRQLWYEKAGYAPQADYGKLSMLFQDRAPIPWERAIDLRRRGFTMNGGFDKELTAQGLITDELRSLSESLVTPAPTLADMFEMARWGINDVAAQTVAPLLAEFPTALNAIARAHGMEQTLDKAIPSLIFGNQTSLAQLRWATHWTPLGLGEAIRMRNRLRPSVMHRWRAAGFDIRPFTDNDVKSWLQVSGYHPMLRDAMTAASYSPIGLRHMYIIARHNNWDLQEFRDRFADLGFTPADTELMAIAGKERADDERWPWIHNTPNAETTRLARALLDGSTEGVMPEQAVVGRLKDLHVRERDIGPMIQNAKDVKAIEDQVTEKRRMEALTKNAMHNRVEAVLTRFRARDVDRTRALQLLDQLGVVPADAAKLVDAAGDQEVAARALARHMQQERLRLAATTTLLRNVTKSYQEGLLFRPAAEALLLRAGIPADVVRSQLDSAEATVNLQEARAAQQIVRRQFLAGQLTQQDAQSLLLRSGVTPDAAARRLTYWQLQLHSQRKVASAEKILAWVRKGLLPVSVARARLSALGWMGTDTQLALAEAEAGLVKMRATQASAAAHTRVTAARQLAQLVTKGDAFTQNLRSQLRKIIPIATLAKWVKNGQVGPDWARSKLIAMGEPADIADLYLEEWAIETTSKRSGTVSQSSNAPTNGANATQPPVS